MVIFFFHLYEIQGANEWIEIIVSTTLKASNNGQPTLIITDSRSELFALFNAF